MIKAFYTILFFLTSIAFASCESSPQDPKAGSKASSADTTRASGSTAPPEKYVPAFADGDIIFQTSGSGQSMAIQLATHSKYSHVGMIFKNRETNKYFVYEAIQPVSVTPLEAFIERGDDKHYVVKRFSDTSNTFGASNTHAMMVAFRKYKGKDYDLYFGWSDDRIYCSELVYKLYKEGAGIELGRLQKLREFDLSSDIVKKIMKERYGDKVPYDETVISPASLFDDPALITIYEN